MFTRGRNVDRAIYRQTVSRFHLICITHWLSSSCTLKRQFLNMKKNSFGWYVYSVPPYCLVCMVHMVYFNCLPSKMALAQRPRDVGALLRHMLLPLFDHLCLFVLQLLQLQRATIVNLLDPSWHPDMLQLSKTKQSVGKNWKCEVWEIRQSWSAAVSAAHQFSLISSNLISLCTLHFNLGHGHIFISNLSFSWTQ